MSFAPYDRPVRVASVGLGVGVSPAAIEYGTYVARVKTAPLAIKDDQGHPKVVAFAATDLKNHQLPDPAGSYRRPEGW